MGGGERGDWRKTERREESEEGWKGGEWKEEEWQESGEKEKTEGEEKKEREERMLSRERKIELSKVFNKGEHDRICAAV